MLNYARLRGQVISFTKDHELGELIFYNLVLDTDRSVLKIIVPDVILNCEINQGDFVDVKCQLKWNKHSECVYLSATTINKIDINDFDKQGLDKYVNAFIFEGEYQGVCKKGVDSEFYFKQPNKYKKDICLTVKCPTINFVKALLTAKKGMVYNMNCKLIDNDGQLVAELERYRTL